MSPILHLGGWEAPAYGAFTVLALVAGCGLFGLVAARRGMGLRVAVATVAAVLLGGLVGARLWAAATAADPFFGSPGEVLELRFGNMAIFGGLLGAALSGVAAARVARVPVTRLADAAAPAVGVGIVLLRTGCLLAGCCFGKATGLPWGITYPEGSLAHGYQATQSPVLLLIGPQPVHPLPIYEMLAGAVLALVALVILKRGRRDGTALAVVVGGYALVRLLIGPLRVPEPGSTPGWFDPMVFALVALAAAGWLALPRAKAWLVARAHPASARAIRDPLPRGVSGPGS